ncbi:MAG: YggT family protein [Anaerolineaceae bacterium]
MVFLITAIHAAAMILNILIIADIVVSYFMSPYNQVRSFLDRIVQPLLNPIRRVVPPLQMIDFSPLILIILIQVLENLLTGILSSMV